MQRYAIKYNGYRKTETAIVVQTSIQAAIAKFGKFYDPARIVTISSNGIPIAKENWK